MKHLSQEQLEPIAIEKFEQHRFKTAARIFERLAAECKANALPHFYLALIHLRKGRLKRALAHGKQVLKINPRIPSAYLNVGCILERMRKVHLAIRYYRKELLSNPVSPQANFNLGVIYFNRRRFKFASSYLEKCLKMRHSIEEVAPRLAFIYSQTACRDQDKELDVYRRYLAVIPRNSWALQNMGAVLMDMSQLNLALIYFKKARQLAPRDRVIKRNIERIMTMKKSIAEQSSTTGITPAQKTKTGNGS
jgi:tetratricopeptide (TPR) repeat protein